MTEKTILLDLKLPKIDGTRSSLASEGKPQNKILAYCDSYFFERRKRSHEWAILKVQTALLASYQRRPWQSLTNGCWPSYWLRG
jgi:hypothetical protein